MIALALLGAMLMPAGQSAGEPSTGFALTASYEREGLPVPQWTFHIAPSSAVDYTSHHADATVPDTPVHFQLSATGQKKLGQWLAESHDLSPCETKTKGLARMGTKTLTWTPAGGAAVTCAFNYSDNKSVSQITEYLSQASAVLENGKIIDRLHRFDRLGLDPVLLRLAAAAKDGKAPELAAIRSSLESLVSDDAVLERVRQRAAELLQLAREQ